MNQESTAYTLTLFARWREAEVNFYIGSDIADWSIRRDNVIRTVWLDLDQQFLTYAEGSWTTETLANAEATKACSCEDCFKWQQRVSQIIKKVEYAIDTEMEKINQERKQHAIS